ncbi:PIR Superfamily Protein [Plasmodium ovale wallikeri]|uniref:PIR Superfamily Protein n=1 Tax=Plasmodium ovale wallikeri TaxID=864142 RepID=A0A1A9AI71_PLAOA|nr:PIR Superfamily Protein [Plasmodium ovale wallikeri]SBT56296.1 PIR Superfamily Protein [Plasmodium ovale wallikeri]
MASAYDNVEHLTSVRVYKQLDNIFLDKSEECSKLESELTNVNTDIILFCMSVAGNLTNYDKLNYFDSLNKYRCKYLNLWIKSHLLKYDSTEQSRVISKCLSFWDKFDKNRDKCDSEFLNYTNEDDYKKTKYLYDYALNYPMLYYYFVQQKDRCTKEDDIYIKKSIDLYKEAEIDCQKPNGHKYCGALNDIKKEYPQGQLLKLTCNEIVTKETALILNEISTLREENAQLKRSSKGKKCETPPLQDKDGESYSQGLPPLDSPQVQSCDSGSHTAMTFVVPIVSIVFVLLVLYKFSSFRPWLLSKLNRKNIIQHNINEEELHEESGNMFHYNSAYLQEDDHRIGYVPMENI